MFMAYVQKSAAATAPRSSYAGNKPASAPSKPKAEGENRPTHSLSAKVGEGESVEFINLTGLFPGQTKDGRAMFKGKPNKLEVFIRMEDGRELKVESLIVTAKN
jgi:hypothetical protein